MNILHIIAIGIISTIIIVLIKETRPELAVLLGVGTGIILITMVVDGLYDIIVTFYGFAEAGGIDGTVFSGILKIVGVGYITEFGASICADAGSKSTGDKILFAGKIVIMIMALPLIAGLFSLITEILP